MGVGGDIGCRVCSKEAVDCTDCGYHMCPWKKEPPCEANDFNGMLPPIDKIKETNMVAETKTLVDEDLYKLRATYQSTREITLVMTEKQYMGVLDALYRARDVMIAANRGNPMSPHHKENVMQDVKLLTALSHVIEHERD